MLPPYTPNRLYTWHSSLLVFMAAMRGRVCAADLHSSDTLLFWSYARQIDRMRFGTSRESLHVKDLFTRYVRDEFLKSDLLHDVSFDRHSTAEEFHRACRHVAGKVIGLTLCRPVSVSDVMVYLGRQQRHVQDFWQSTPLFDLPVMFIEVLEHTSLFVLKSVYMSTPGFAPRGSSSR